MPQRPQQRNLAVAKASGEVGVRCAFLCPNSLLNCLLDVLKRVTERRAVSRGGCILCQYFARQFTVFSELFKWMSVCLAQYDLSRWDWRARRGLLTVWTLLRQVILCASSPQSTGQGVVVIGAGLAGLACATKLHEKGVQVCIVAFPLPLPLHLSFTPVQSHVPNPPCRSPLQVTVLEASDGVGGRARTDRVEGFLLDRGFAILLSSYPEQASAVDLKALNLGSFYAGAAVRHGGAFHRVADPFR